MKAFIDPPPRIPWYLRIGLWVVKRMTGKDLLPPRLLAWYPKAAIGSAVLESLIAHDEPDVPRRMLRLVRVAVSMEVNCPFCIDMNGVGWQDDLTNEELLALQGRLDLDNVPTLTPAERLAVRYARLCSQTPLSFPPDWEAQLAAHFTPRQVVILASTAAQVNYWARLIQGMGCPPAGYHPDGLFLPLGPGLPGPHSTEAR